MRNRFPIVIAVLFLAISVRANAVYLRLNQLGFYPADIKNAVAFSTNPLPTSFAVIDAATEQTVFEGKTMPLVGMHWAKFENLVELDFSAVKRMGHYRLVI